MNPKIWIVARPHYSPTNTLETMGICGSGFFIRNNIFITAYHILNESSFLPNAQYFNTKIFLLNPEGNKIEIDRNKILKMCPEIDTILIKVEENNSFFETEKNYSEMDLITNIGYPTKSTMEILDKNLVIKKQYKQDGKILKIHDNYSMNANDVKLMNKKVIILDYSSEEGFSGGPLLKNDKVIGLMSHLYPNDKNAVAISIDEIEKILPIT